MVPEANLYPRFAEAGVLEALADSPVVLLHGPRQCGKTTLAKLVGARKGYAYITFDDDVARAAAESDPAGFVDGLPPRVILDEVQRVPSLFTAIKTAIDRRRDPGRFLLTGSANVLLVPRLADSLAGRMAIQRLHPLSEAELERRRPSFLDTLFGGGFKARRTDRLARELPARVAAGGYPAALVRQEGRRRAAWYRDYLEAIVQRDVRDLARIGALDAVPRLLGAAAGQTARLLNVTELAAPFSVSRPTIRDYMTLLQRVFLVEELPAWHSNRLKRLVKSPKLHLGDTGLACSLLGVDAAGLEADRPLLGRLTETFVFQELRRQASWHKDPLSFFHFRDKDGVKVDIVIERGPRAVAAVEVKASATVRAADFSGMRKLKAAAGRYFAGGVVLYDGEIAASFGDGLFAVPIRSLWGAA
jgi:predicted AAA+ superfamily ATPase